MKPGLYTIEDIAKQRSCTIGSAYNYLTSLRQKDLVERVGKIYKIHDTPIQKESGFYAITNKTPIKLVPEHTHVVHGKKYTAEDAIVTALEKNESRFLLVSVFLCNHITHWSTLLQALKKKDLLPRFKAIYLLARKTMRVRRMPLRYKKVLEQIDAEKIAIRESDVREYR
ncbi:MAG: hypothetical protein ACMXYK_00190 [Candidatus Woesearchaeota archaeon]